jgi:hypothetical protein
MEEKSKQKPSGLIMLQRSLAFLYRMVPKQKLFSLFVLALLLLLVFNSLFGFWDRLTGAVMSFLRPPEVASVDLSNTITNAVVSRGMLVTSESHQTNRDIHVSVSRWVMNSGGYEASHFAEGTIFAGVNLESKLVKVTKTDDTHYQIMLPPAEITSCSLKPLTQYDRSTSAFADWETVLDLASYMAMREFVTNALQSGLIEDAESGAKRVIGDLIGSVVGDDITIEITFHTNQTPKIDDTCVAQEPREWVYDAEEDAWTRK